VIKGGGDEDIAKIILKNFCRIDPDLHRLPYVPLPRRGPVDVDNKPNGDKCETNPATMHLALCGELGPAYTWPTADLACRSRDRYSKADKAEPATEGPCVERTGTHHKCKKGGTWTGTTVGCCTCCENEDKGPRVKKLCAVLRG
jgi:hypothetical protein